MARGDAAGIVGWLFGDADERAGSACINITDLFRLGGWVAQGTLLAVVNG